MIKNILRVVFLMFLGSWFLSALAQTGKKIEAIKAPFYVGENVMACGQLVQIKHLKNVHYLNFDYKYPEQTLTIVIWTEDYSSFEERLGSLDSHKGKRFCARGTITEYKNYLQIIVKNPQFLRLMK